MNKILHFVRYALVTATLGMWPLAYSAPPGPGMDVTHGSSSSNDASAFSNAGNVSVTIYAQAFENYYGYPEYGAVTVYVYDSNTSNFWYISCGGPLYANVVSVVQGNGNATIRATLDPSSPDCLASNVPAPVLLDLAGRASGTYHTSSTGFSFSENLNGRFKYRFQDDSFGAVFSGMVGNLSGPFEGSTTAHRTNSLEQIK